VVRFQLSWDSEKGILHAVVNGEAYESAPGTGDTEYTGFMIGGFGNIGDRSAATDWFWDDLTFSVGAIPETRVPGGEGTPDPYESWLAETFTPEQLADPAVSGGEVDLDLDGYSTFAEWALGLDPFVANAMLISPQTSNEFSPRVETNTSEPDRTLRMVFRRRIDHTDLGLTYRAEFSNNLLVWIAGEVIDTNAIDDAWEQVTVQSLDDNAAPTLFVRLMLMRSEENE
jgi:hypothetical protein